MANKKISELAVATAPTGAELIEIVQGGVNKQTTTQDIANLGGGGGGTVTSVTGTTNRITSTGGATPVIDIDAAYDAIVAAKAPLASPTFTGTPAAPTAAPGTNTTQLATTAFVQAADALKQTLINAATVLTDAASMDLTAIKHTLTTSSATRTFTISYTGDYIYLEITLNAATCTLTFPATSLCRSEGIPSGDNTCILSGSSGDVYVLSVARVGSNFKVASANFGQ